MPDTIEEPLIETSIRACTTLDAPSLAVLEKITEKLGVSSRQRAATTNVVSATDTSAAPTHR